ncbi:MAG TPA: threonine ammonia-lyase [Candidatus Binatus sp.]|uniref:threonine ammonia-lyase n=1 Tax=Candidatus Binatus sp. TaxID=2811406 RepID=UPI002B4602F8|nr:threonine ammonia-lyase [Candidatus Binatus sp.]HKN15188.1 threonine ammonia-lyase [Candidatus Binatus sp.]
MPSIRSSMLEQIEQARERLAGIIKPTPLMRSATLDRILAAQVLIKPENLQKTGSFKIRGAYNRLMTLTGEQKSRGVVAASAGNRGQALAYAATRAGVTATIVMPATAAIAKIDATRSYGQSVKLEGVDYQEARAAAKMCAERGASFVDAYDDAYVIAGQGTVGLEIADEVTPDVVLVPVGGGGLISGIAAALATYAPAAEVIGVEAGGSPQLSASLAADAPASIGRPVDTIADGLATGRVGAIPFEVMRGRVKRAVTVDDFEIGEAVLLLLERLKLLAEGAGAASLAGALKLKDELKGKTVVLVVSGGNIDINLLDRIIGHGLVKVGRLFRVAVDLRDRPGELGKLVSMIAATGANVRAIDHDRTRRDIAIGGARVMLELETRGPTHIEEIREQLKSRGYVFEVG